MSVKILADFKPGPLDFYRKRASFDWKKLKSHLDTEELVTFQDEIVEELKQYPEYTKDYHPKTFDQERQNSFRQSVIYSHFELLKLPNLLSNLRKVPISGRLMMQVANDATIKYSVSNLLYNNTIQSMGTRRHAQFVVDNEDGKVCGCFCLTEIGHGTNTKGMRTTATYDEESKEFIVESPDFEAAKCWAGALGQSASIAVVFAQLVVKGEKKGLHCFVVPIRDPDTLTPYPGIIVGDMGEKLGLNGVDNGFVMFKNYRIPRENLLNKMADVTEDGNYVTPFTDPNKRHGASLGTLSHGRVSITNMAAAYGLKALTIAIRYAGVRKQFGPTDDEEVPILEYQTHQHRLIPHLASGYVVRVFCDYLLPMFFEYILLTLTDPKNESIPDKGVEIHAISSGCKPVASWAMRDAIQECREACGGHGYLKAAGIGDLRNSNDANCTYEGENHVLIQQTSNWLLKFWPSILEDGVVATPFKSADFLTNAKAILNTKFTATRLEQLCSVDEILRCYQWLVSYLLRESYENLEKSTKNDIDQFWAKSNNQVYLARELGVTFIQHFFLQKFLSFANQAPDENIKIVLLRLFYLYGLTNLEKHLGILYKGGFATDPTAATLIQEGIVKLCADLKDDAVALIDATAPPDYAVNSVLGASDGKVYQRLESTFLHSSYGMSRPKWWRDVIDWKSYVYRSKL